MTILAISNLDLRYTNQNLRDIIEKTKKIGTIDEIIFEFSAIFVNRKTAYIKMEKFNHANPDVPTLLHRLSLCDGKGVGFLHCDEEYYTPEPAIPLFIQGNNTIQPNIWMYISSYYPDITIPNSAQLNSKINRANDRFEELYISVTEEIDHLHKENDELKKQLSRAESSFEIIFGILREMRKITASK